MYRACPKCDGNMFTERSEDGDEDVCVQCGKRLPAREKDWGARLTPGTLTRIKKGLSK